MSILFRAKGWLTVDQLVRAWAGELPGAEKDPKRFEQDLAHLLLEDVANGRLDDAGPLAEGQRLGLRIVTSDFRAGSLEGRQILDALRSGCDAGFLGHRILVMKEAALTFAQRHNLPPPSWWQNDAVTAPDDLIGTAALGTTPQNPGNQALPRKRARPPKKFEETKQAMEQDILQGRLTATGLKTMLEREISEKYSVSRISLFIGGVTAVIMELAEPRVRAGVWEHTTFRVDPIRRLRRTGLAAMVTVYGARSTAETMIARIRRMHDRIAGTTSAGKAYRANDPEPALQPPSCSATAKAG